MIRQAGGNGRRRARATRIGRIEEIGPIGWEGPVRAPVPGLSVVIAVWNQWHLTEACLRSLLQEAPGAEVTVVDNGSTDETPARLAAYPVRVIRFCENRGVAPAWNAGLREASGDVLCVLNNDTVVEPGGMQALAEAAGRTGIAAWLGGRVLPDLSFGGFTARPEESDYPDGCCLAFRRDAWETVGEFDEAFAPAYCEDSDWGLRARLAGYRWEILPWILRHVGHQTADGLGSIGEVRRRSQARLRRKWSGRGAGERIRVRRWAALGDVLMALPALRAARRRWPLARIHLQTAPPFANLLAGTPDADEVSPESRGGYTRQIDLDGVYEREMSAGVWRHPAEAFAEAAGVSLPRMRYPVPEPVELRAWAEEQLPGGPIYIACGLRSAFRRRAQWHEQGWRELVEALPQVTFVAIDPARRPSLECDRRPAREFYSARNILDLTGQTPDLRHVFALLLRCDAAVSVDTGLYHLASAAGLPVVGLFAGVPGRHREPLVGPRVSFDGDAECFPCPNPVRCVYPGGGNCLAGLTGARVAEALRRLLGGER